MASLQGEQKLTQKVESIHTYSKKRDKTVLRKRGSRNQRGVAGKRPNNEIHSYAKSPASGSSGNDDHVDMEEDSVGANVEPLETVTESLNEDQVADLSQLSQGQRQFFKNILRRQSQCDNSNKDFWQEVSTQYNRRFGANITGSWVEKMARLVGDAESLLPQQGQVASPLAVLEAATAPVREVNFGTCQQCSDTTASMAASVSLPPGHPDIDHSYYGLPAYPEPVGDISQTITIEESHRLLQAVLTLSTSQITQVALDIPSLRSALTQSLSYEKS